MVKIEIQTKQSIKRMIADDTAGFYRELSKLKNEVRELRELVEGDKLLIRRGKK